MTWWQVVVKVTTTVPEERDVVVDRLWTAGAASIEERADGVLVAGFDDRAEARAAEAAVGGVAEEITEDGWLDAWRAHARPLRVGRLVVQPVWVAPAPTTDGDVVLHLDPGRAFGDGAHPTTRTVLQCMLEHLQPGQRVLDAGCGSGVLAVAAVLAGAADAVAVDIDPHAVRITRANADANGVGQRVAASTTALEDLTGSFELVLANIGAATLVEVAPVLVARTAPGGVLVLSGILGDRADAVVAAYERLGCRELRPRPVDAEWSSPVLRAP